MSLAQILGGVVSGVFAVAFAVWGVSLGCLGGLGRGLFPCPWDVVGACVHVFGDFLDGGLDLEDVAGIVLRSRNAVCKAGQLEIPRGTRMQRASVQAEPNNALLHQKGGICNRKCCRDLFVAQRVRPGVLCCLGGSPFVFGAFFSHGHLPS